MISLVTNSLKESEIIMKSIFPKILSVFIAFVFIQSLFFKFTYSPETEYIFSTLEAWAQGFGVVGFFVPPGIFNAYVIGTAELVASLLLLAGLFLHKPLLQGLGAVLALGVISGAIFFHLFTPLGIDVLDDGGTLFYMACGVWVSSAIIIFLRKNVLCGLLKFCCHKKAA